MPRSGHIPTAVRSGSGEHGDSRARFRQGERRAAGVTICGRDQAAPRIVFWAVAVSFVSFGSKAGERSERCERNRYRTGLEASPGHKHRRTNDFQSNDALELAANARDRMTVGFRWRRTKGFDRSGKPREIFLSADSDHFPVNGRVCQNTTSPARA